MNPSHILSFIKTEKTWKQSVDHQDVWKLFTSYKNKLALNLFTICQSPLPTKELNFQTGYLQW